MQSFLDTLGDAKPYKILGNTTNVISLTYNELQSTLYHFNTFSTTVPHTFQCSTRIQSVPYTFHTPSAMFHTHSTVVHPRSTVFSTRYTVFHTNSTMFHSVPHEFHSVPHTFLTVAHGSQCSTNVPQTFCYTAPNHCILFHMRSTHHWEDYVTCVEHC